MQNNAFTPFKVTDFGTSGKRVCSFLCVDNTNLLSCTIFKIYSRLLLEFSLSTVGGALFNSLAQSEPLNAGL